MNRTLVWALSAALGISLWFHWRGPSGAAAPGPSPGGAATPAGALKMEAESMDFSGTGLADGAWRLEAPEGEKIPASLPDPAASAEDSPDGLKALPSGSEELGSGIRLELGGAGSGGG